MEYYIGIDGGGTKSRLLAVDKSRHKIGEALGSSTNLLSNSKEYVYGSLKKLFTDFFETSKLDYEGCLGLCIGSAGLDSEHSQLVMEELIKSFGFICPVIAINDSVLALAAATGGKPGVVVVSGTGSIAYGMDSQGKSIRCGGWGHILDDGGSGYWIGCEALKAALHSVDGRGEKTILLESFKEEFQVDYLPDCIDAIYNRFNKAKIASYALFVKEGAAMNDIVCLDIIKRASKELFLLADGVLRCMSVDDSDIIVSGGTILNNDMLFSMFEEIMEINYPKTKLIRIQKEPVLGAIYIILNRIKGDL